MKKYEKPKMDVCVIYNEGVMAVSGGLTSKFTPITGNETNSIDVDNLN